MKIVGAMKKKIKELTWKHGVAFAMLIGSVALLIFCYRFSWERALLSVKDLWASLRFWFILSFSPAFESVFGWSVETPIPTVLDPISEAWKDTIRIDIGLLEYKIRNFGFALFNADNFKGFMSGTDDFLLVALTVISYVLPIILILPMVVEAIIMRPNKRNAAQDTKAVSACKWFGKKIFSPFFRFCSIMIEFFRSKKGKFLFGCLVLVWLLNLNMITVLLEAFAYYFYVIGMLLVNPAQVLNRDIFIQLSKLFADSAVMFSGAPLPCWLVFFWILFDRHRKKVGADEVRHMEAMNTGYAKNLPICVCAVGEPGVGKTTFMVDLGLTLENVFRAQSLDTMFRYDLMFPRFPVQRLEEAFVEQIENGNVHNLPQIDLWVDELKERGENFGYAGIPFSNGIMMVELYATINTYCHAYFIYIVNQYILSNVPVRTDSVVKNAEKCFPLWDNNFLNRDPRDRKEDSKFSHILDQDIMRLGKKIEENNPFIGSFGFGIYLHSEWGKSRGNKIALEGVKADADETNQKNDFYAYSLKMCRHAESLVDFFPYFKFVADEQRPENVPADLRDFTSIVSILGKSETALAMPHFILGDMLYDFLYKRYQRLYYKIRNVRKDNFLFLYLSKLAVSAFVRYYTKIYNTYGYQELELMTESGRNYGNAGAAGSVAQTHPWFRLYNKIYSERFLSDCYASAFRKAQLDSGIGINDYPSYTGLGMTLDEMEQQHDYFMMDMFDMFALPVKEARELPTADEGELVNTDEPLKVSAVSDAEFDPFDC